MIRKLTLAAVTAALAIGTLAGPVAAKPDGARPDTDCMRAGIATLKGAGLLDDAARGGIPISLAVSLGVTPRESTDLGAVPDPIPFPIVLADHRAGDGSLFIYPWCE